MIMMEIFLHQILIPRRASACDKAHAKVPYLVHLHWSVFIIATQYMSTQKEWAQILHGLLL